MLLRFPKRKGLVARIAMSNAFLFLAFGSLSTYIMKQSRENLCGTYTGKASIGSTLLDLAYNFISAL
jgi:hypothetical protein